MVGYLSSLWSSPGAHLGTGQVTCSCALGQPWTSSSLVNYYYFYYIYYVYRIRSPKSFLCFSESTEQPRTGHDRRANSTTRRINKSEWRDLNEGGVVLSEYGASFPEISPLLSNFTFHWIISSSQKDAVESSLFLLKFLQILPCLNVLSRKNCQSSWIPLQW